MGWTISVIARNGRVWNLSDRSGGVYILAGGLPALGATRSVDDVKPVGADYVRRMLGPYNSAEDSFKLMFQASSEQTAAQNFIEWSTAWEGPVMLLVEGASGSVYMPVEWPEDKPLPSFDRDPHDVRSFSLDWPFWGTSSLWKSRVAEVGPSVTVRNAGKSMIYPSITWLAGGTVSIKDGPSFTLPTVPQRRTITLNVSENFLVTNPADGQRDDALWKQLRSKAFTMPVRPGAEAVLSVPASAVVEWEIGVTRPWR